MAKLLIFTIGHSNHMADKFISLLKSQEIQLVTDVRTLPQSRHNPQFNGETLKKFLKKEGIGYEHIRSLGGLRRPRKDSVNTGWQNVSFRGYADYMDTEEFKEGLEMLMKLAKSKRTAIMCSEALHWRCHRNLVADALMKKGWKVFHIQNESTATEHELTPFLKVQKGTLIYPSAS